MSDTRDTPESELPAYAKRETVKTARVAPPLQRADTLRVAPARLRQAETLMEIPSFRQPKRYRGGYLVGVDPGHELTGSFKYSGGVGDAVSAPFDLAERINFVKVGDRYLPFRPYSPNGCVGVVACAETAAPSDDLENPNVVSLNWLAGQQRQSGAMRRVISSAMRGVTDGAPTPDPVLFYLYLKLQPALEDPQRTEPVLHLADVALTEGCAVELPIAHPTKSPEVKLATKAFFTHAGERQRAVAELREHFLGRYEPRWDVYQWLYIKTLIDRAVTSADEASSSPLNARMQTAFLANFFVIGRVVEALFAELDRDAASAEEEEMLERYRQALVVRYGERSRMLLHSRVNASLMLDGRYGIGLDDLLLRHIPLMRLDGQPRSVSVTFGPRLEDGYRRDYACALRIDYKPR